MSAAFRAVARFLRLFALGTVHRLRRAPTRSLAIFRRLLSSVFGPPATANPHYAHLARCHEEDKRLDLDDVNAIVVPLLVERGRDIERMRAENVILYFIMAILLVFGAFFGQRFLEGTRTASRANCIALSNVIVASGADGSPTIAGELQSEYRAEIEKNMSPMRKARVNSLKIEQERAGVSIMPPPCEQLVRDPDSVHVITIPPATRERPPGLAPAPPRPRGG